MRLGPQVAGGTLANVLAIETSRRVRCHGIEESWGYHRKQKRVHLSSHAQIGNQQQPSIFIVGTLRRSSTVSLFIIADHQKARVPSCDFVLHRNPPHISNHSQHSIHNVTKLSPIFRLIQEEETLPFVSGGTAWIVDNFVLYL